MASATRKSPSPSRRGRRGRWHRRPLRCSSWSRRGKRPHQAGPEADLGKYVPVGAHGGKDGVHGGTCSPQRRGTGPRGGAGGGPGHSTAPPRPPTAILGGGGVPTTQ